MIRVPLTDMENSRGSVADPPLLPLVAPPPVAHRGRETRRRNCDGVLVRILNWRTGPPVWCGRATRASRRCGTPAGPGRWTPDTADHSRHVNADDHELEALFSFGGAPGRVSPKEQSIVSRSIAGQLPTQGHAVVVPRLLARLEENGFRDAV